MSLVRLLTTGKSLVDVKGSISRYRMSNPGALPKFGGRKNPFTETVQSPSTVVSVSGTMEDKKSILLRQAYGGQEVQSLESNLAEQGIEDGEPRPEDRGQRAEDREQRTESRGQGIEQRVQGSGASEMAKVQDEGFTGSGQKVGNRSEAASAPVSNKPQSSLKGSGLVARSGRLKVLLAKGSRVVISTGHWAGGWVSKIRELLPGGRKTGFHKAPIAKAGVQGELSLEHVRVVCSDLSDADLEVAPIFKAEEENGGKEKRDVRRKLEQKI